MSNITKKTVILWTFRKLFVYLAQVGAEITYIFPESHTKWDIDGINAKNICIVYPTYIIKNTNKKSFNP